jgi:hypothetical protein
MAELKLNLRKLNELTPLQAQDRALARQLLTEEHPGRFSVSLEGGRSLRLRTSTELSLIAFVGQRLLTMPPEGR